MPLFRYLPFLFCILLISWGYVETASSQEYKPAQTNAIDQSNNNWIDSLNNRVANVSINIYDPDT